jgi:CubicO group peptidase (beta-lactamase class C family)
VVRVEQHGEPILERAFGWASRTWRVPATTEIRFDTASVTKLFTAVAVLQQVEAGSFALDTSAVNYLELVGTTISPDATVHHLLSHTSGIGDDADEEAGEEYEDLFRDKPNYSIRETVDFLPQIVNNLPNFAPGEGARYCNVAFVLLGLMVERATGLPYREYAAREVFERCGMSRSGFFAMDAVVEDVAEGTDPIPESAASDRRWRRSIYSYPPIGSPDSGAHVTAADLATFYRALTAGELLGPELTASMLTPKHYKRESDRGEQHTGYGFEFELDVDGAVLMFWKEGINVGVSAMLAHFVQADLTVAMLSNTQDGVWEPFDELEKSVLDA